MREKKEKKGGGDRDTKCGEEIKKKKKIRMGEMKREKREII